MILEEEHNIKSIAVMADDHGQKYRYRLTRVWDNKKEIIAVIMLNPSVANSLKTDATIMKLTNFLIDKEYGGVDIVNVYAYMHKNPSELKNKNQMYESYNDDYILKVVEERKKFIIAWGSDKKDKVTRKREIENLLLSYANKIKCLKDTSGKTPRHPLNVTEEWEIVPYKFRYI